MSRMRVTVTGDGVALSGYVESPEVLAELATAVRPFEWLITATPAAMPHSRACGIRKHDHGPDCHPNCPTCSGRAFS